MDLTSKRLAAQRLIDSDIFGPLAVADRLLAIQAQDPRGARLAVRSRLSDSVEDPRASAVDEALGDRALVVGWLNRGTLHLVAAEDYWWLHALTAPRQATSNQTRLRQEGVSEVQAERGVELIVKRLADGPATRAQLRDVLELADVPVAGQALVHILYLASIRGLILRGPMSGKDQAFVLAEEWLGPAVELDREVSLGELARRYLVAHGPATDADLAAWAGIPLGQARNGLKAIGGELVETDGLIDLKKRTESEEPGKVPALKLLGPFDPVLHGWKSREWIVPSEGDRQVVTTNGLFRASILAGDRIVGTWKLAGGKFEPSPFEELNPETAEALEAEKAAVSRYLDD